MLFFCSSFFCSPFFAHRSAGRPLARREPGTSLSHGIRTAPPDDILKAARRATFREKLAAEKAAAAEERRLSDTPVVQPAEPSPAEKAAGRPAKSGKEKISREKKEKSAKESGFMKLFRKKSDVKEEEEQ